MTDTRRHVLTLTCDDRPGIVRALAEGIVEVDGNIVESSQFSDPSTGRFFLRTAFDAPPAPIEQVRRVVHASVADLGPTLEIRLAEQRARLLVLVSRHDHCLVDLLYRWSIRELPVDIPVVVSNHPDTADLVERHGIRFEHVPVTADTKAESEARLFDIAAEEAIDLVALARYMQVLSPEACQRLAGRAINIHHSFLPGFKGARPYHQAFERGVKLIGATAHYVTADLDEGPIIEQDVVRVSHADTVERLQALGRDVERVVLARAVRLHAEGRVFLNGARTVVLP
jgi:formyltetrahydrofolate deformylase